MTDVKIRAWKCGWRFRESEVFCLFESLQGRAWLKLRPTYLGLVKPSASASSTGQKQSNPLNAAVIGLIKTWTNNQIIRRSINQIGLYLPWSSVAWTRRWGSSWRRWSRPRKTLHCRGTSRRRGSCWRPRRPTGDPSCGSGRCLNEGGSVKIGYCDIWIPQKPDVKVAGFKTKSAIKWQFHIPNRKCMRMSFKE